MIQRSGAGEKAAENFSDSDLLREVMNTIGREGRLGENVRCVVSVSMLTEGWDANTVTQFSVCAHSAPNSSVNRWLGEGCAGSPMT